MHATRGEPGRLRNWAQAALTRNVERSLVVWRMQPTMAPGRPGSTFGQHRPNTAAEPRLGLPLFIGL